MVRSTFRNPLKQKHSKASTSDINTHFMYLPIMDARWINKAKASHQRQGKNKVLVSIKHINIKQQLMVHCSSSDILASSLDHPANGQCKLRLYKTLNRRRNQLANPHQLRFFWCIYPEFSFNHVRITMKLKTRRKALIRTLYLVFRK